MPDIYHHRGCKIIIATIPVANGTAVMRYEITPESDEARAAFKRRGVDLITGTKMSDAALGDSRREIDLLLGGRG